MIALDTNLLVYAHRTVTPQHGRAQAAIERAAQSGAWGIPSPCVSEFWFTVTRTGVHGASSTPQQAASFLQQLIRSGAAMLAGKAGFPERLFAEAERRKVTGLRIYDLQIALAALDGGATELWTHDSDFLRLPGLKVVDPF